MALNFIKKNPLAEAYFAGEARQRAFDQQDLTYETGQEALKQSRDMHPLQMEQTQAVIHSLQGREQRAGDLHAPDLRTSQAQADTAAANAQVSQGTVQPQITTQQAQARGAVANADVAQGTVQPRIQAQEANTRSALAGATVSEKTTQSKIDLALAQADGDQLINVQRQVQTALQMAGSGAIDQGVAMLRDAGLDVSAEDSAMLRDANIRKAIGEMRGVLDAQFGHDPKAYLTAIRQVWENTTSGRAPFEGVIASNVPKPTSRYGGIQSENMRDSEILATAIAQKNGRQTATQADLLAAYDMVRQAARNPYERAKIVKDIATSMVNSYEVDNMTEAMAKAEAMVDGMSGGVPGGGMTSAPQTQPVAAQPLPNDPSQLVQGEVYQTSRGPARFNGTGFDPIGGNAKGVIGAGDPSIPK